MLQKKARSFELFKTNKYLRPLNPFLKGEEQYNFIPILTKMIIT